MLRDFLKKLSFGMLVLFVGMQTASAQSFQVEDPEPEVQTAGYDGGFFIQSQDKKFRLKINGVFIPRFQFVHDPQNTPSNVGSALIRYAGLSFSTRFLEKFSFKIGLGHATGSNDFRASNVGALYLTYDFSPKFSLSTGMVGLPLDMGGRVLTELPLTPTQTDQVQAITIARESFGGPAGLGLSGSGTIGEKASYVLSVVNGSQSNYDANDGLKISFGGQLSYDVIGNAQGGTSDVRYSKSPNFSLNMGALYESKKEQDLGNDSSGNPLAPAVIDNVIQTSAGAGFKYKGLGVRSELYLKRINVADPGGAIGDLSGIKNDFGYYAAIGYFLIPKKFEIGTTMAQIFKEG